ncbi:unnamed protein product [Hermetia illucens]|uniref:Uncharacterized protein n=1 Tax=Hermetia illucens TaxID=343691 RepID=A0A7R8V550_HERIL|nr:protein takeout-like [Hermetia illucens]XP_037924662.1 protein takeout-like [Hermetia illucens]CAD7091840.1 unnamed protein product [Hermetia illucens]
MCDMTKIRLFGGTIVTLAFLINVGYAIDTLPEYVKPCSRSDPGLNTCIKNSFNYLKPYLKDGLTELGVPSLEPLEIDELIMDNNAGAVRIKARFSSIAALGASNYSVREVRNDIKNLRIDMSLGIPRVEVTGKYDVAGNVLLLPVRSHGNFWAEFLNISAIAKLYGQEKIKNGKTYMYINKLGIDFTMKNARFKVEDKLNTQNILGEAINQFLNQNAKELIQEMRPTASQSIARLLQKILNTAFGKLEMSYWLHD